MTYDPKSDPRVKLLTEMDTRSVIKELEAIHSELCSKERELLDIQEKRRGFSERVEFRLAELSLDIPGLLADGRKITNQAQRDAWLAIQEKEDTVLREAVIERNTAQAEYEARGLEVKQAQRRFELMLTVLKLRRAQIEYLAK